MDQLKHVRIFEDITAPKLKFLNLMNEDKRIEKVWSREGTIYYIKNDAADNKVYKIHSLYDGGQMLGYDFYLSKGALVRLSLEFLMEQVKKVDHKFEKKIVLQKVL